MQGNMADFQRLQATSGEINFVENQGSNFLGSSFSHGTIQDPPSKLEEKKQSQQYLQYHKGFFFSKKRPIYFNIHSTREFFQHPNQQATFYPEPMVAIRSQIRCLLTLRVRHTSYKFHRNQIKFRKTSSNSAGGCREITLGTAQQDLQEDI